MTTADGPKTIVGRGLGDFERAVEGLLKEPAVLERWNRAELWGIVASLVVAASQADDSPAMISRGLQRLREAGPSLVVLPLANVVWKAGPRQIAGGVIGRLDDAFDSLVAVEAHGRADLASSDARDWVRLQVNEPSREVIAAAVWVPGQMQAASSGADRWVEDVCNLALLFEADLGGKGLWSLRGAHNRPGVRGLVIDRPALEHLLREHPRGGMELASQPFVVSQDFGIHRPVHWYSADPFPLDELLTGSTLDRVGATIVSQSAVRARLRLAARWYAEAHWSVAADDAALALGVALDALVGSRSGIPGRVMSQRFAHLDSDVSSRRMKQARYNEVHAVRSAVAHGGQPSRLRADGFVRSMAEDVRWAADRLLAFEARFAVTTDAQLDESFERLALGELAW